MRRRLLWAPCLAAALACAGCGRAPAATAESQAAAVAIAVLEKTASECDRLSTYVSTSWAAEGKANMDAAAERALTADLVRRAGPALPLAVSIGEAEAERRVADLQVRQDFRTEAVNKAYLETWQSCDAAAHPERFDRFSYARETQRLRERRDAAMAAAKGLSLGLDGEGQRELRLIFARVRAAGDEAYAAQRRAEQLRRSVPALGPETAAAQLASTVGQAPGSAPQAAPPPSQPRHAAIALQAWRCVEDGKRTRIEGIVRNAGERRIESGQARVRLVTWDGEVIARSDLPFELRQLAPNETTRFSWTTPWSHQAARCRLSFADGQGQPIDAVGGVETNKQIDYRRRLDADDGG